MIAFNDIHSCLSFTFLVLFFFVKSLFTLEIFILKMFHLHLVDSSFKVVANIVANVLNVV